MQLPTPEAIAYLRLLREALRISRRALEGDPISYNEQYTFWARFQEAEEFCDIINTAEDAGLNLLIKRLEGGDAEL